MITWLNEWRIKRRMLKIVRSEGGNGLPHQVLMWYPEDGTSCTPPRYYVRGWMGMRYVAYYCPKCDKELTCGPTGGGTNMVCARCGINYGCLPLSLER